MDLEEKLRGFIRHRIKDTVSDSMFDKMLEESTYSDIDEGRVGEINEAIDKLTSVVVETLMEKRK